MSGTETDYASAMKASGDSRTRGEISEEIGSLLTWLSKHPQNHLNTGHLLIVRCESCGHTVQVNEGLVFAGVPCTVCEEPMHLIRWKVAQRDRKNPYSFGRSGRIPSGIDIEPAPMITTETVIIPEPEISDVRYVVSSVVSCVCGEHVGDYKYVLKSQM